MPEFIKHGSTTPVIRMKLRSLATGQGITGLTNTSSGLRISVVPDTQGSPFVYTSADNNIESITTLGTYQTPSAGKARFREVNATNHRGLYEIHLSPPRFAHAGARRLYLSVQGVENLADEELLIIQDISDSADLKSTVDSSISDANLATSGQVSSIPGDVLESSMDQSYAELGEQPSLSQALYMIQQMLTHHSISGSTWTVKNLGGSTVATFTIGFDAEDRPISITRNS